ncbi:MAG: alpha/beta fold hydrolase [Gammaproteobacteria bacterium]
MQMVYDEEGTGAPVVLLHGLGATGNVWRACASSLSKHFRTLCPDLPGSGRTPASGPISTGMLAEDLRSFMDALKLDRAHLVGHSYGSVVLQHFAVRYPDRVRSLSLVGPIQAPADPVRKALADRAAKARSEGLVAIANATVQAGTSMLTKAQRPEVAAFVRELVMRQDPNGYALTCEAVASTEPAALDTLKCPTLVITGDEDATSPPPVAKAVADRISGSRFHVLPYCGHWTPVEQVRSVSELLFNFLIVH